MRKFTINIIIFTLFQFTVIRGGDPIILTLEESLRIALEKSYDIKYMEQDLIRDRENVKAARAALKSNANFNFFLPSFKTEYREVYDWQNDMFKYEYTQKNRLMSQLVINQPIPTNGNFSLNYDFFHETQLGDIRNYSNYLYLKFEQPIFTPNVLSMGIRRAELGLESTELDYKDEKLEIEYDITRSYFYLYRAFAQVDVNEKGVELLEESYDIAKDLQERGLLEEMELLQLEVELANSRDELLTREGNLERQKNSFKQTIGLTPSEDIKIITDLIYTPININDQLRERTIATGLKNSIRIRNNEVRKEFKGLDLTDADRLSEFKGSIVTTLGFDKKDSLFTATLRNPDQTRSITLELYLPLWDWGRNKAQVKSAEASLRHTEIALDESILDVKRRLEDELRNLQEASNRLEILERSKRLAEKSYYLGLDKFKNSKISSQDLILSIDQLISSHNSFLNAFVDFQLAKARLKRMVNGSS
ncbi:MAG: TolC family protein [Candidatus Helarchaeota archaeon]|nr:TolC family protein [Candidatus Helarchaeota archaeon]